MTPVLPYCLIAVSPTAPRREKHKDWEKNREERVGTWRDFVGKKSKDKKTVGELKAPKVGCGLGWKGRVLMYGLRVLQTAGEQAGRDKGQKDKKTVGELSVLR